MHVRLVFVHPGTRQAVILGSRLPAKRRREALADLLRTRRERLTPDVLGLPNIGRRRTPGLRREEVAQLAGVSAAWYTWLEQARDIRPSTTSLDSIARALRFTEVERAHAYALAGHVLASPLAPLQHEAPPLVQAVLDALTVPAYVSDRAFNVIGWNKLADSLLGYSRRTERNTLAIVFGDPTFREAFVNFADEAAQLVANLRRAADEAPDDPAYEALVARSPPIPSSSGYGRATT